MGGTKRRVQDPPSPSAWTPSNCHAESACVSPPNAPSNSPGVSSIHAHSPRYSQPRLFLCRAIAHLSIFSFTPLLPPLTSRQLSHGSPPRSPPIVPIRPTLSDVARFSSIYSSRPSLYLPTFNRSICLYGIARTHTPRLGFASSPTSNTFEPIPQRHPTPPPG